MHKQGILVSTVRTTLNLAGAIPVGIVQGLSRKGGTVDRYINENKDRIREVIGAGIIAAGAGSIILD